MIWKGKLRICIVCLNYGCDLGNLRSKCQELSCNVSRCYWFWFEILNVYGFGSIL